MVVHDDALGGARDHLLVQPARLPQRLLEALALGDVVDKRYELVRAGSEPGDEHLGPHEAPVPAHVPLFEPHGSPAAAPLRRRGAGPRWRPASPRCPPGTSRARRRGRPDLLLRVVEHPQERLVGRDDPAVDAVDDDADRDHFEQRAEALLASAAASPAASRCSVTSSTSTNSPLARPSSGRSGTTVDRVIRRVPLG